MTTRPCAGSRPCSPRPPCASGDRIHLGKFGWAVTLLVVALVVSTTALTVLVDTAFWPLVAMAGALTAGWLWLTSDEEVLAPCPNRGDDSPPLTPDRASVRRSAHVKSREESHRLDAGLTPSPRRDLGEGTYLMDWLSESRTTPAVTREHRPDVSRYNRRIKCDN